MKMKKSRSSKMFSALVIGGGLLVEPSAANENNPVSNMDRPLAESEVPWNTSADPHCQLEFALQKFDREGDRYEKDVTCLDKLSDDEILKVIKESRSETCMSPFCGCWLG